MVQCFLLLWHADAKWIPFVAIPAVLAGGMAAVCLMVSGIKGILTEWCRPKRKLVRPVSPERVVQWIAPRGHRRQNERVGVKLSDARR